jgi:hypothetical protein
VPRKPSSLSEGRKREIARPKDSTLSEGREEKERKKERKKEENA